MLNCKLYEVDILVSREIPLEPMVVVEDINLFHKFAEGFPSGAILHPMFSAKHNKFA